MLAEVLSQLFERDIQRLRDEINGYQEEANIWVVKGDIANSAGNLCLHLCGNLNHFIGSALAENGYKRNREYEFAAKDVPLAELNKIIDQTAEVVVDALNELTEADFELDFPLEKHGQVVSMHYMLLHLLTHLNYHLGQVNYHRRLVEG